MEVGQDEHAQEPTVITSHLAYFFIPLPDLLGFPDKHVFKVLENTLSDRSRSELPTICVSASLCFHRAKLPTAYAEELSLLFDLAAMSLQSTTHAEGCAPENDASRGLGDGAPPVHSTTVVEMAVAVELSDVDESIPEHEQSVQFYDRLTEAFDRGLNYVRQYQRAYYLMQREPIRLVTRESLPFAVPFGIREIFDPDGQPLPFNVPLSAYFLNANAPVTSPETWSDSDTNALHTSLTHQSEDGPFASFLDLVRESDVALIRDGAYRSAVVFTATACELLFDELLAHMMWEEEMRPEEAAGFFDTLLTPRVKSQYHGRLGGSWKLDAEGPIGDWSSLVARLRNRVVHGGHEPTLGEAGAAVAATTALTEHLGDLVADRAEAYPRTALVIPGEEGLKSRGRWTNTLNDLRNEPSEVRWSQTFSRWRMAMQRARKDSPLAQVPSVSGANVYLVVRIDGTEQWIAHDSQAGMAAVVECPEDVTGVSPEQRAELTKLIHFLAQQPDRTDVSVGIAGAGVLSIPPDRWVSEYRLVPLTGVMVNGKDLDPALP